MHEIGKKSIGLEASPPNQGKKRKAPDFWSGMDIFPPFSPVSLTFGEIKSPLSPHFNLGATPQLPDFAPLSPIPQTPVTELKITTNPQEMKTETKQAQITSHSHRQGRFHCDFPKCDKDFRRKDSLAPS